MSSKQIRSTAALLLLACATSQASEQGDAQDRCLVYGFKIQNNLALCTEFEMQFGEPRRWSFKDSNAAQDNCLRLGFRSEPLAACTQRQLRGAKAATQPAYDTRAPR